MPHFSKQTATTDQAGPGFHEWTAHLDDYTANHVELEQDMDLAPLLKGLPNDHCQCPHWGYQIRGTQTVHYEDGATETYGPGDVFYMRPGHAPKASAGSEFVVISPTDQLAISEAVMQRNMQALQSS